MERQSTRRTWWWALALGVVGVVLVAGVVLAPRLVRLLTSPVDADLAEVLAHRGRIAWVGPAPVDFIEGTSVARLTARDPLLLALSSRDPSVAPRAFDAARVQVLVVDPRGAAGAPEGSALARFGAYAIVPGFRTIYLRDGLVVAERHALPPMTDAESGALARAARQILGGAIPPRLSQFPPSLRAPFSTEVLVIVRRPNGEPALWRSARSSSLASGMMTAAGVARERWDAREDTVGGPIPELLPRMSVEVAVLVEDGSFGTRTPGFIDRAVQPEHGVAYDDPSTWRYLLPESDERRAARTGSDAFRALFRDNQIRGNGFENEAFRLYRIRVTSLGVSPSTRD